MEKPRLAHTTLAYSQFCLGSGGVRPVHAIDMKPVYRLRRTGNITAEGPTELMGLQLYSIHLFIKYILLFIYCIYLCIFNF